MAKGNRHLGYKEALNQLEVASPGSKFDFYHGFLARASDHFAVDFADDQEALVECERCGAPTPSGVCAFCRLVEKAAGAVPVAAPTRRSS